MAEGFYRPVTRLVYTPAMEYDCHDLGDYVVARLRASGIRLPHNAEPEDIREALGQVHFLPTDHPAAAELLTAPSPPAWTAMTLTNTKAAIVINAVALVITLLVAFAVMRWL